ncbi:MAG: malto-oligosyltrehalose trehalohydrolase [Betaproteobacteria bacterium RIFCSPLOWO2_02_FULL_65_24]|nr:MAG: malto-oligosyltrehalose trehalohydrolase [Betaproteobacteria bacterium RIFCSPLOWO2_02_FULL_65_24]OGA96563.1 MAG: malto-oligosyltrehalose trehalohydrolase [Betaproteobacteria bacterium RIFCSPLOWO2_12_FULL_66_14]
MKRWHDMPFGATVLEHGQCRFRLWAPAARTVELCLELGTDEETLAMDAQEHGWFETTQPLRGTRTRYRYRIDANIRVPDPASRYNPLDVHGPSEVVDPRRFEWQDGDWTGRPWEDAVIYELHVGAFTREGSFRGVESRLDYLAELGVTAVELMPLADFPGARGWGYDGVLPFAPDASYGSPEELKRLVQAAHRCGLMVLLDVVYNHFGPEGNYLHAYAPQFFTERHQTPWGAAINFSDALSRVVRDFFIHNALYWLEEFHFDGLRLDAVHAIADDSPVHILTELADAVHAGPGRGRAVHLVLENDLNRARFLKRDAAGRPQHYTAQWNDDFHHAAHVALTGEDDGYYADFGEYTAGKLARCLSEGFAYQGDPSPFRGHAPRGEPSSDLPPEAFVNFLQNHDQVGNRAFGERLVNLVEERRLAVAVTILLLAPSPPLLFMGEEFGAASPFLFFCDLGAELATAVREGRRKEFSRFERFKDPAAAAKLPDPGAQATFQCSRLDWDSLAAPAHARWLEFYRRLLGVRRRFIAPALPRLQPGGVRRTMHAERALEVRWRTLDGAELSLAANLGEAPARVEALPGSEVLYATDPSAAPTGALPPWSVLVRYG